MSFAFLIICDAGIGISLIQYRPRLVSCKPEYWTGYRAKHRDSPYTAGSLSLDYEPYRGMPHVVVPVVTVSGLSS